MKIKTSIYHSAFAFAYVTLVAVGCTYKHDGKMVKDTEGRIYKLKGSSRTSESYHLIEIDTTDYRGRFK